MKLPSFVTGESPQERIVPPSGFTALLTVVSAGAMAFLAVFAMALAFAAGDLAERWQDELAGTATVRLSTSPDASGETERVLTALMQTPGIADARALGADEQQALLEPWLGIDLSVDALELPVLIAVTEEGGGPDVDGLRQRLRAEAPGAVYDTHGRWRAPLSDAALQLRRLATVSLVLIAVVTAVTIALATSAALAANGRVIDVLRLVGARDGWITRAFVRRFTLRALAGALVGTALAMFALAFLPEGAATGILDGLGLNGWEWLWPLIVPPSAAVLAFGATHVAARRRLSELT